MNPGEILNLWESPGLMQWTKCISEAEAAQWLSPFAARPVNSAKHPRTRHKAKAKARRRAKLNRRNNK